MSGLFGAQCLLGDEEGISYWINIQEYFLCHSFIVTVLLCTDSNQTDHLDHSSPVSRNGETVEEYMRARRYMLIVYSSIIG